MEVGSTADSTSSDKNAAKSREDENSVERSDDLLSHAQNDVTSSLLRIQKSPGYKRIKKLIHLVEKSVQPIDTVLYAPPPKRISSPKSVLGETLQASPFSLDAYWARVSTYTSWGWFNKPFDLSPLECSLTGWSLYTPDSEHQTRDETLICSVCHRMLRYVQPEAELLKEYCEEFRRSLKTTHRKECAFFDYSCPSSFYKGFFLDPQRLRDGVRERMKELKSWKGECEDLESTACIEPVLSYAESAGLEVRRVAPLVEFMYFDSIATGCELMKKKLNLSVLQMMVAWIFCGWGASWLELKDKRALTWTCKMCKRKVMMDLSTSKDPEQPGQSEQSVEATGSPTSKLLGFDGSTLVNPLEEHRSFCPWICPLSKSESDSEGWKLCIKALKFVHCFTDRRTAKEADVKDALPRVSQMLDRVKKNRGAAITEAKRA